MTQLPDAHTVRGNFDGREVRYGKDAARPFRDGERFCIEIKTSTEASADVLNRISQIAGARPWLLGVAPAQTRPDPTAPDPKLIMAAAKAMKSVFMAPL